MCVAAREVRASASAGRKHLPKPNPPLLPVQAQYFNIFDACFKLRVAAVGLVGQVVDLQGKLDRLGAGGGVYSAARKVRVSASAGRSAFSAIRLGTSTFSRFKLRVAAVG